MGRRCALEIDSGAPRPLHQHGFLVVIGTGASPPRSWVGIGIT